MHNSYPAKPYAGIKRPPRHRCLLALVCACSALGPTSLQAQTVYRSVGPNGQVTFSDKPPVTPASKVTSADKTVEATPSNGTALPFELRQVVAKYPVTLYASSNCAPCDSGRALLAARGVPFTEKMVISAQDADALQSMSGSTSLPFLTIGAQHVAGFSSSEWAQYLSAAGYPERSKLPAGYRSPSATPLTTAEKPAASAPTAAETPRPLAAPVAPRPNPNNPAGIQF